MAHLVVWPRHSSLWALLAQGYCTYPFVITTGQGSAKRHSTESPGFHRHSSPPFPTESQQDYQVRWEVELPSVGLQGYCLFVRRPSLNFIQLIPSNFLSPPLSFHLESCLIYCFFFFIMCLLLVPSSSPTNTLKFQSKLKAKHTAGMTRTNFSRYSLAPTLLVCFFFSL